MVLVVFGCPSLFLLLGSCDRASTCRHLVEMLTALRTPAIALCFFTDRVNRRVARQLFLRRDPDTPDAPAVDHALDYVPFDDEGEEEDLLQSRA